MNQELKQRYEVLENDRKRILEMLRNVPEDKLMNGKNNKWSISQILSHLILAERMSLLYMKKKLLGIQQLENTGFKEEIKSLILTISQYLPLKYKAPLVLSENTPPLLPLSEIQSQWQANRNELKLFLESLDDEVLKKKIFKHPVVGRLNIIQAITFFRDHVNHHLPQIKRLL